MFLHVFWNIRNKKIGMFFFSKNFAKIKNPLFFENFFKNFSSFSKTTKYFFLIIFGTLRRHNKTSFKKKNQKKNRILFLSKNFATFFFWGKILAEINLQRISFIKFLQRDFLYKLGKNIARKKCPKDFLYKIFIKGFPL